jgi:hypothetical protein
MNIQICPFTNLSSLSHLLYTHNRRFGCIELLLAFTLQDKVRDLQLDVDVGQFRFFIFREGKGQINMITAS